MVVLAAVAKLRYVPPNDWIAAVLTQSKTRLYNASEYTGRAGHRRFGLVD